MHCSKDRRQTHRAGVRARALRLDPARETRCAIALLALVSLATVSVVATTTNLSRDHQARLEAEFRH